MPGQYARRWCFTINNYTEEEVRNVSRTLTEQICHYAVVGYEEAPTTGTPHLQGFAHFKGLKYMAGLKKLFGAPTAHFQVARGTNLQNQADCKKGGDLLLEVGDPGSNPNGFNKTYLTAVELAKSIARGAKRLADLRDEDAEAYCKHTRFVDAYVEAQKNDIGRRAFMQYHLQNHLVMHRWQTKLYDLLTQTKPDDRKIYWYVDFIGGAGKSTFVNYFMARHKSVCFFGGKLSDLSYAYDREPVVFFDLSKSGNNSYLLGFMEQLKNGRIFNSKYQSGFKFFAVPHVVVFSNSSPPQEAFAKDRLQIQILKGSFCAGAE